MRTAVVDMGTTACRLVVAETVGGGRFRPCDDRRVALGLGRAVRRDGRVGEGRLELTIETLRRLRASASNAGAETLTATLAERLFTAVDGPHLHHCAGEVLDVPVRVVDAADDLRATLGAVRYRHGLASTPCLVDVGDHHLRAAAPRSDGTLQTIEVAVGVRDLVPAGVHPQHPAAFAQVGDDLAGLLAPFTELGSTGSAARRSVVVTGEHAITLGRAALGRRAVTSARLIDGLRLPLSALARLEDDVVATCGRRSPETAPELVALSALTVRSVLERLGAQEVQFSDACPVEGRLRAEADGGGWLATGPIRVPAAPPRAGPLAIASAAVPTVTP